jgi:hypothetical protein
MNRKRLQGKMGRWYTLKNESLTPFCLAATQGFELEFLEKSLQARTKDEACLRFGNRLDRVSSIMSRDLQTQIRHTEMHARHGWASLFHNSLVGVHSSALISTDVEDQ